MTINRTANWHKKHMSRKQKDKKRRKYNTTALKVTRHNATNRRDAEVNYQRAIAANKQAYETLPWYTKLWLKFINTKSIKALRKKYGKARTKKDTSQKTI